MHQQILNDTFTACFVEPIKPLSISFRNPSGLGEWENKQTSIQSTLAATKTIHRYFFLVHYCIVKSVKHWKIIILNNIMNSFTTLIEKKASKLI